MKQNVPLRRDRRLQMTNAETKINNTSTNTTTDTIITVEDFSLGCDCLLSSGIREKRNV